MKVINHLSRSIYRYKYPVKGTFNLGEICPIGSPIEVTPYDEFTTNVAMVLRMATPIAPIMDDLDVEITAHFVPLRLIGMKEAGDTTNIGVKQQSTSTPNFEMVITNGFGAPADWMATDNQQYSAPTANWNPAAAKAAAYTTIGEALGLGLGINAASANKAVLAYPLYGYNLIYQERFRNQNVEAPQTNLARGSNLYGKSGSNTAQSGTDETYNHALSVAYKHGDHYTNAVPSPQKGAAVQIPLGTEAPLKIAVSPHYAGGTIVWTTTNSGGTTPVAPGNGALGVAGSTGSMIAGGTQPTASYQINGTNLVADLRNAAAASVNNFIDAYNIQRLLMKDIKGTRYFDVIKNHFGVINDDIRLYIPELLGIKRFAINISPVVQQSGSDASTSATSQGNILGTTGGYSFTANNASLVSHKFGEFGYIYLLVVVRQRNTYGQGIPKLFQRSKRFDWFFPELGRIGYQPIDYIELNAGATAGTAYGYEPAWEELRYVNQGQAFGFLNPTKDNSLDYWTLTESLTTLPTLGMSFLKQYRTNLARALTIGDQGPDFIMDALVYGVKSTLVPIGTEPKLFN